MLVRLLTLAEAVQHVGLQQHGAHKLLQCDAGASALDVGLVHGRELRVFAMAVFTGVPYIQKAHWVEAGWLANLDSGPGVASQRIGGA